MGIPVTRTSVAVGNLLTVLGDMPAEMFMAMRSTLLKTKAPETRPEIVPLYRALGELMAAIEDDELARMGTG